MSLSTDSCMSRVATASDFGILPWQVVPSECATLEEAIEKTEREDERLRVLCEQYRKMCYKDHPSRNLPNHNNGRTVGMEIARLKTIKDAQAHRRLRKTQGANYLPSKYKGKHFCCKR